MRRLRRDGIVLVLVAGILGLFAVLALAFTVMAQVERRASRQRLYAAKARFLARSGLEDAFARVAAGQDPAYGGENWDGDAPGLLTAYEAAQQTYRITGTGTAANLWDCPASRAMRPSFYVRDPASATVPKTPLRQAVQKRDRGLSGALSGDLFAGGDRYALRVVPQGGFYVNGGDPGGGAAVGYNAILSRILGTLAEALDQEDGVNNGLPVDQADGTNLIALRPGAGWASLDQIRTVALGGSRSKLDALAPYLCLQAWTDKGVIAPNIPAPTPPGALPMVQTGQSATSWGAVKRLYPANPVIPGSLAPDFERLPRTAAGRVVGRAPVDLAWARTRRPALIALIAGLQGRYLDESTTRTWSQSDAIGGLASVSLANAWSATDDCHVAATAILTSTSALSTWQEFNAFCDTIPFLPVTATTQIQARRDVLKANFNPNADLNKFNPGAALWKSVDKGDLLVYSTEFSLSPLQPCLVESSGRVVDARGRLLAQRTLRANMRCPRILRLSSQRDFACAGLGDPALSGDETGARLPGSAAYLSESRGSDRTWGHRVNATGWMDGDSQGVGLQTYPEPCYNRQDGTGLHLNPAPYDGRLELATLDTISPDEYYNSGTTTKTLMMLARLDDGLDLDYSANPAHRAVIPDAAMVGTNELDLGLLSATKLNTLYPDGIYSEKDRVPGYYDGGNAHGFHGALSFWIKPSCTYANANWPCRYPRTLLTRTSYNAQCEVFTLEDWPARTGFTGNGLTFWIDHRHSGTTTFFGSSTQFQLQRALTPHVWNLVTAFWDIHSNLHGNMVRMAINDGLGGNAGPAGFWKQQAVSTYIPSQSEDLTLNDSYGEHVLRLGARSPLDFQLTEYLQGQVSSPPDATIDEFALWDFGGAPFVAGVAGPVPADALAACARVCADRFQGGHYYPEATYAVPGASPNGEAGSYTTPAIPIPPGSLIRSLRWTWYRPSTLLGGADLSADYAELELLDRDGAAYLFPSSRSTRAPGWTRDLQAWAVNRTVPASPLRIRAVFRRTADAPPPRPILESPALDDLDLVYDPPGGPGLSSWEASGD